MLFWSSVVHNTFWKQLCVQLHLHLHSKCQCDMLHLQIKEFAHQALRTNTVKHQQESVVLYLIVAWYSLHADDWKMF